MKYVYIVMGETGEYSDQNIWTVKAFSDQLKAEQFMDECNKESDKIFYEYKKYNTPRLELKHSLDPNFEIDYTGTSYFVTKVELGE